MVHRVSQKCILGNILPGDMTFVNLSIIPSQNALNYNQLTTNKNIHLTSVKLS